MFYEALGGVGDVSLTFREEFHSFLKIKFAKKKKEGPYQPQHDTF